MNCEATAPAAKLKRFQRDREAANFLAVSELKLEKAKAGLEKITEAERQRLPGYDADEVEHSPSVRRAANAIRRLQFQLTVNDEILWSNFVSGIDDDLE